MMLSSRLELNRFNCLFLTCAIAFACFAPEESSAEVYQFRLNNGDRLSGTIVSESTNQVVISNAWTASLAIPTAEISKRERVPYSLISAAPGTAAQITTPPSALSESNKVAAAKSPTNSPLAGTWKGEVRIGLDFIEGTKDRQNYYGRLKLAYERPYPSDPKKFFRNDFDFNAVYEKTEGVESANHIQGIDKTAFDIGYKLYAYNLLGAGYDKTRKIDFQFEAGPGIGRHLFTRTNFTMNVEGGFDYQVEYRSDGNDRKTLYFRLAEDFLWKIRERLTLAEKFEFFPRVDNVSQYRSRFESTLSYSFWKNLSFNLTVLDQYDTQPAPGIEKNEFELRSSLGFKF